MYHTIGRKNSETLLVLNVFFNLEVYIYPYQYPYSPSPIRNVDDILFSEQRRLVS